MAARRSTEGSASDAGSLPLVSDAAAAPSVDQLAPFSASLRRANVPHDPLIGQVIAERYRVDELLGVGGMGCVYRAEHIRMRKVVALKVLHRRMNFVAEAVARFEQEAIAAARILHPNVAAANDFGQLPDGTLYMVLEFVEGKSLRDVIREDGAMHPVRALDIVTQIGEALSAAHEQGVVHRDLKPENVMLTGSDGRDIVKVLDFGIAKLSTADSDAGHLTQLGSVIGTPEYMSPEQAAGKPVDHRTDLYALGAVFYELLAGAPPFSGPAIAIVLTKQMAQPPPTLPDTIDPRVARLVMCLLEKDPDARLGTAQELVAELRALRLSRPPPAVASVAPRSGPDHLKLARSASDAFLQLRDKAASSWHRLRRFLGPPLEALWQHATTQFPKLMLLEQPVSIGRLRVPIWGACAAGALALGVTLLLVVAPEDEPRDTAPAPLQSSRRTAPKPVEATRATEPRAVTDKEFRQVLSVPAYERKLQDWLTLGKGHLERERWSEATAAYRNALQLDRASAKDPVVLGALRMLAEQHETYKAAINVADNLLGNEGMDLLYDLWAATKDDKAKRLITEHSYKKLKILHLNRGSEALRVRLGLEFAGGEDCAKLAKLVANAIGTADQRALPALQALQSKTGCGPGQKHDCHPCLRETEDLQTALETASKRTPPGFADGMYHPGG